MTVDNIGRYKNHAVQRMAFKYYNCQGFLIFIFFFRYKNNHEDKQSKSSSKSSKPSKSSSSLPAEIANGNLNFKQVMMTSNLTQDVKMLLYYAFGQRKAHVMSLVGSRLSVALLQGYCSTNCNAEERRQAQCIMKAKTKKHLENNILWVNVKTRTLLTQYQKSHQKKGRSKW